MVGIVLADLASTQSRALRLGMRAIKQTRAPTGFHSSQQAMPWAVQFFACAETCEAEGSGRLLVTQNHGDFVFDVPSADQSQISM